MKVERFKCYEEVKSREQSIYYAPSLSSKIKKPLHFTQLVFDIKVFLVYFATPITEIN